MSTAKRRDASKRPAEIRPPSISRADLDHVRVQISDLYRIAVTDLGQERDFLFYLAELPDDTPVEFVRASIKHAETAIETCASAVGWHAVRLAEHLGLPEPSALNPSAQD